MLLLALGVLAHAGPAVPAPVVRGPIAEIEHPRYRDATGRPLHWRDVRAIASRSDAARQVRRRRWGRTVLRAVFAGATALEVWGTWRLARDDDYLALPLGAQAASTGLVAVLLWTSGPQAVRQDRALMLDGANGVLLPR